MFREKWLEFSEGRFPREFGNFREKVEDAKDFVLKVREAVENCCEAWLNIHTAFNRYVKCELPYLDKVFLDLDGCFDKAYGEMRRIYCYLKSSFGADPLILFSGRRSFHIYPSFLPVVEEVDILDEALKTFGSELKSKLGLETLDSAVFNITRMGRIPYTLHPKSVGWCVPIEPWFTQQRILKLSTSPRECTTPIKFTPCEPFRAYFMSIVEKVRGSRSRIARRINLAQPPPTKKYSWVDKLLQKPIADGRHRTLWLIFAPYLTVVRGLSVEEAASILEAYYAKCNTLRPLPSSFNKLIKYHCEYAVRHKLLPISLNRLKEKDQQLHQIVTTAMGEDV